MFCFLRFNRSLFFEDSNNILRKVQNVFPHPFYYFGNSTGTPGYDIALVQLETRIQFGNQVNPICLPSPDSRTSKVFVAGWGIKR